MNILVYCKAVNTFHLKEYTFRIQLSFGMEESNYYFFLPETVTIILMKSILKIHAQCGTFIKLIAFWILSYRFHTSWLKKKIEMANVV